jgi:hypothetical protein
MNGNDTNSTIGTTELEVKQNNKTLVSGSKIWSLIEDKFSSVNFFRCSKIFEENYDKPIQLSIISIICRGILKEVNLL